MKNSNSKHEKLGESFYHNKILFIIIGILNCTTQVGTYVVAVHKKNPISMQKAAFVRSIDNRQEWQANPNVCNSILFGVHERKFQCKKAFVRRY
jgi:hypothetical protein